MGGESGAKARPMKKEWALNIQQQCQQSGVQFFFKQWGLWGDDGVKRSKKLNGRKLNGKIFDEMPYQRLYQIPYQMPLYENKRIGEIILSA